MADRNSLSEAPLAAALHSTASPPDGVGKEMATESPRNGGHFLIRRFGRYFTVPAFVVAIGLGYHLGQSWMVNRLANGGLVIDAEYLDFGSTWVAGDFKWRLPIQNRTSEPIEIVGIHASCACASVEPKQFVVPPHSESVLSLTLDLRPDWNLAESFDRDFHSFSVHVRPMAARGVAYLNGWTVTGLVQLPFQLSSPIVDFGDVEIGGKVPTKIIEAELSSGVASIVAEDPDGAMPVDVKSSNISQSPSKVMLSIALKPSPVVGSFSREVKLLGLTDTGNELGPIPLQVRGALTHPVQVSPSALRFGSHFLGTRIADTVTLVSTRRHSFLVKYVECDHSRIDVQKMRDVDSPEAIYMYRVSIDVAEKGSQSSNIKFHISQHGAEKSAILLLPVAWHGRIGTVPENGLSQSDAT